MAQAANSTRAVTGSVLAKFLGRQRLRRALRLEQVLLAVASFEFRAKPQAVNLRASN